MSDGLRNIAASLFAKGKGILAADETAWTLTRRFERPGSNTDRMEAEAR